MRKNAVPSLEKLCAVASDFRNDYLLKAKNEGRRIVGLLYQEIPEEVITAAGGVPVVLRGTGATGTEYAEAYFRQLTCNYTRCTFDQIMQGKWDFLDGAVIFNGCDHVRRIYDNWKLIPGNPVYHFFYSPKKKGALAKAFYAEQVREFIKATESRFGVTITPEKLRAAIVLHNETRRLQQALYEMQKGAEVYLSGAELMSVMLAGVSMPREDYNRLLVSLIDELKKNGETMRPAVRLIYLGGHADSPRFFASLESRSAQVVADAVGFGGNACEALARETGDPLEALIDFYFDEKPAVPRNFGTQEARLSRLTRLVHDYHADGVVCARVSMCDVWALEQFMIRDRLAKENIPLLELEVDYLPDAQGQIATRMQAFVESITAARN